MSKRSVEEVKRPDAPFPDFLIKSGFQTLCVDKDLNQFVIPAPALKVTFSDENLGWTLRAGEFIPKGAFITWYCGPSVNVRDYFPNQNIRPGSLSSLHQRLKEEGLGHLTTHMLTVKKNELIVNSCPSSVNNAAHTTGSEYALKFLCEYGGVQSIANDTPRGKKVNTFRLVLQIRRITPFGEEQNYMMTLWADEDINQDEEVFHDYGAGYWKMFEEIKKTDAYRQHIASGGAPLGQWWRPEYDLIQKREEERRRKRSREEAQS